MYRVQARLQFIDFKAHLCDVAVLRKAFSRGLAVNRRRAVVRAFSFLGKTGRELSH